MPGGTKTKNMEIMVLQELGKDELSEDDQTEDAGRRPRPRYSVVSSAFSVFSFSPDAWEYWKGALLCVFVVSTLFITIIIVLLLWGNIGKAIEMK